MFGSAEHGEGDEAPCPLRLALGTLAERSAWFVGVLLLMVYMVSP